LIEHELNHVLIGWASEPPSPDPTEVADWRWIPTELLSQELGRHPEAYTAWFPLVWDAVIRWSRTGDFPEFEPPMQKTIRELGVIPSGPA
jgi:isopentenyldiphosphate isomerase